MLVLRPSPLLALLARPTTILLALVLTAWLWLGLAAPAAAQAPAVPEVGVAASLVATPGAAAMPATSPTPHATATPAPGVSPPAAPPAGSFDPIAAVKEQVQKTIATLLANTIRPFRDTVRQHVDSQFNFLTTTHLHHSAGLPQVGQFHQVARAIANGAVALILIVGGNNLLFRRHLTGDEQAIVPLLGRVVLAGLVANTALLPTGGAPQGWAVWFIQLNNALIAATTASLPVTFDGLFAAGAVDPLNPAHWVQVGPSLLLALLILAVLMLVFLLWVLQMIVRLALLNLLLAVAPIALILWVLPQTGGWARLWWRLFLPTLFSQFLQVAALGLAARLSSTLFHPNDLALAPLMSIATLVLVLKLPGLIGAGFAHAQSLSGGVGKPMVLIAAARRAFGRG